MRAIAGRGAGQIHPVAQPAQTGLNPTFIPSPTGL